MFFIFQNHEDSKILLGYINTSSAIGFVSPIHLHFKIQTYSHLQGLGFSLTLSCKVYSASFWNFPWNSLQQTKDSHEPAIPQKLKEVSIDLGYKSLHKEEMHVLRRFQSRDTSRFFRMGTAALISQLHFPASLQLKERRHSTSNLHWSEAHEWNSVIIYLQGLWQWHCTQNWNTCETGFMEIVYCSLPTFS